MSGASPWFSISNVNGATGMVEVVGAIFMVAGSVIILIGSLGILRFPNFMSRIHAAGVIDTLGAWTLLIGLLLLSDSLVTAAKVVFIGVLLFVLSPVVSHALARQAKSQGLNTGDEPDRDTVNGGPMS